MRGSDTLVPFHSPAEGGNERLYFPKEHQELAAQLYTILAVNGVEDNIAFVDLRDVNRDELPTVEPERGLEAIVGDPSDGLCLDSKKKKMGWYCRHWIWHNHAFVCAKCEKSTCLSVFGTWFQT